ncbi:hypothetical protein H632_c2680p0 [Helicosporidium sp. ATCC 50920]|nr:hypothetical protein H632_c2680p0 [Helicosporidium sp. ATCC 50920]|eukprot:KDD72969.1 hypothetical protein H632_c2680p0 [Helicosporidium sp. ATCC 50920]
MVVTLSPSLFTGTWKAGTKRSFYAYNVLATGALKQLVASPGVLSQRTDFVVNPGIVVSRIVDEGAKAPNRIRVDLTNVLGRAITVKDVTLPNGRTYALYWTIYLGVAGLVA